VIDADRDRVVELSFAASRYVVTFPEPQFATYRRRLSCERTEPCRFSVPFAAFVTLGSGLIAPWASRRNADTLLDPVRHEQVGRAVRVDVRASAHPEHRRCQHVAVNLVLIWAPFPSGRISSPPVEPAGRGSLGSVRRPRRARSPAGSRAQVLVQPRVTSADSWCSRSNPPTTL
jgi:hypothetical protein